MLYHFVAVMSALDFDRNAFCLINTFHHAVCIIIIIISRGASVLSIDCDKCAMVIYFLGGSIKNLILSLIYKNVNFVHKFNN